LVCGGKGGDGSSDRRMYGTAFAVGMVGGSVAFNCVHNMLNNYLFCCGAIQHGTCDVSGNRSYYSCFMAGYVRSKAPSLCPACCESAQASCMGEGPDSFLSQQDTEARLALTPQNALACWFLVQVPSPCGPQAPTKPSVLP
jgi:hypothetical protein